MASLIPISLELTAFGPFRKKQIIDFTAFESERIFLISGKTGSGKTTIFDAITFCLYGKASGDIRDSDSFKSDFADANEVCSARFDFILHSQHYSVFREPAQSKLRRNGNITLAASTAELTLDNGEIISGTLAVNEKIEELLCINADQFKKIVMLPQGEFRKFLSDDTDEKQKTLRKIFSTSLLDEFTQKLRENAFSLQAEMNEIEARCGAFASSIKAKETDEISVAIEMEKPDISHILLLLQEKNQADKKALADLKSSCDELNKEIEKINLPFAEQTNNSLDILEKNKTALSSLTARKEFFSKQEAEISALKALKPLCEKVKNLEKLIADRDAVAGNINGYEKKLNIDEKKLELTKEKLASAQSAMMVCVELEEASGLLSTLFELQSGLDLCKKLIFELQAANDCYQETMNAFVASQAFFLSGKLEENAPCPVCGSKSHPHPATESENTTTKEQLDAKKHIYDKAMRKLKEQQTICNQFLQKADFDVNSHDKLSLFIPEINQKVGILSENIFKFKASLEELGFKGSSLLKIKESVASLEAQKEELSLSAGRTKEAVLQQNERLSSCNAAIKAANGEFSSELLKCGLTVELFNEKRLQIFSVEALESQLNEYKIALAKTSAVVESLSAQLTGLEKFDILLLRQEHDRLKVLAEAQKLKYNNAYAALCSNLEILKSLDASYKEYFQKDILYRERYHIFEIANGKYSGRINFERYVLASYFGDVLKNANLRLEQMTNSRYTLSRRNEKEKGLKASGLSLEVFDAYTGRSRHVNTLSGGESFKVSLCLALGLADIVSQNAGGIELNTIFIDEGFGSLDSASLDSAIECLYALKNAGRYIGIISHVNELKEKLPARLTVIQEPDGSRIEASF